MATTEFDAGTLAAAREVVSVCDEAFIDEARAFGCAEAEAIAGLYAAAGREEWAAEFLAAHAAGDEPEDEHYVTPGDCADCDGTGARVADDGPEPGAYYVERCATCDTFASDAVAADAVAGWLGGGWDETDANGSVRAYVYDVGDGGAAVRERLGSRDGWGPVVSAYRERFAAVRARAGLLP